MIKKIERLDAKIAVYNAEKQELVGVFNNARLAAKFIYNNEIYPKDTAKIYCAAARSSKIKDKPMGFKMAFRFASKKQINLLDGEVQYITDKYKYKDE